MPNERPVSLELPAIETDMRVYPRFYEGEGVGDTSSPFGTLQPGHLLLFYLSVAEEFVRSQTVTTLGVIEQVPMDAPSERHCGYQRGAARLPGR